MSFGLSPAAKGEAGACVKPPLPFPNRIVTFLLPELATARSSLPSRLRSAMTTQLGAAPTRMFNLCVATFAARPPDRTRQPKPSPDIKKNKMNSRISKGRLRSGCQPSLSETSLLDCCVSDFVNLNRWTIVTCNWNGYRRYNTIAHDFQSRGVAEVNFAKPRPEIHRGCNRMA